MPTESVDAPLIPADDGDVEAMAQLWAEAFPEKPAERRKREIREGMTYGDLSDCWVVRQQGRIAGALRTYRFTTWLWGRAYPTMGLAGVATAPDFRRRGLGRRMCRAALEIAHERGDVLSALFPFRTSFYRDLGYTLVGSLHRYRFSPGELATYPGWDRVVRDPHQGEERARAIYDRVVRTSNGLIERTEKMWSFLGEAETYLYLHRNEHGEATGYVVVRGEGGPPDRSTLHVVELVADTREAYLALLGWLSVQRDQWARVVYDAVPGENFMRRLAHPRTQGSGNPRGLWFHSAHLLRGPMLRIVNLERFMSMQGEEDGGDDASPSDGTGRVTAPVRSGEPLTQRVQVRDLQIPDNQGVWNGGRRVETALNPGGSPILTIGEATALAVEGGLPGQLAPPRDWTPNLGLTGYRLLDEF